MNIKRAIRVLLEPKPAEETPDLHEALYGHEPSWLRMWIDDEDLERGLRDGDCWCFCGRVERTGAFRYPWQAEANALSGPIGGPSW